MKCSSPPRSGYRQHRSFCIPVILDFSKDVRELSSLIFLISDSNKCVKSVQIRNYFWSAFSCIWTEYGDLRSKSPYLVPNIGKYGPKITPYLDTFNAVYNSYNVRRFVRTSVS